MTKKRPITILLDSETHQSLSPIIKQIAEQEGKSPDEIQNMIFEVGARDFLKLWKAKE